MNAREVQKRIAEEMTRRGMTQLEAARQSGLEQANISRYLNSKTESVTPTAFKLLEVLDLELVVRGKLNDNMAEWKAWE